MGRPGVSPERRVIGVLSRLGVVGTVESAALPALAAARPDTAGDEFWGPRRTLGGPPARQQFWEPLRDTTEARRLWDVSEQLTGVHAEG